MSRPRFFVATSVVSSLIHSSQRRFIFWSRPLNDVATLIPCKLSLIPTLGTIPDSVLMSRPLLNVATSMFSLLKILCRDFYSMSRPPCILLDLQFCRDLEMVSRHHVLFFINLWLLDLEFLLRLLVLPSIVLMPRLEFCGCDLDVIFHYCQGVATSGPFFLVHLSCCDIIQPVVSFLLRHFLLLLLQYPLFLEFPAA